MRLVDVKLSAKLHELGYKSLCRHSPAGKPMPTADEVFDELQEGTTIEKRSGKWVCTYKDIVIEKEMEMKGDILFSNLADCLAEMWIEQFAKEPKA